MTAEQQEPEYIITREQLTQIANLVYPTDYQELTNVFGVIRSRPHSPLTQDTTGQVKPVGFFVSIRQWGLLRSPSISEERKIELANEITQNQKVSDEKYSWDWCIDCPNEGKIRQDERNKVLDECGKRTRSGRKC